MSRRLKTLKVPSHYHLAKGPVNLLMDSTDIGLLDDGECQAHKHGVQGRCRWRRVHLAMDTATYEIRAVEFTSSRHGNNLILPDLLEQPQATNASTT